MKVLVTGAAGFIGKHLVQHLVASGDDVVALDVREEVGHMAGRYSVSNGRPPLVTTFQADITNDLSMDAVGDVIKESGPVDKVVHLAAVASPPIAQRDPVLAWSTNVHGTQNVLQLALKVGSPCVRVVFFSSAHVYGISPKYMPTDENHPLALHDTYTTTKILGEQLCRLYYENHGLSYVVLRLWNAYGPGQSPDYFIGKKISQALHDKTLTLRNEDVTKDWVHVSDVVTATSLAMKSDYVGPLNVGTGKETSLREIAETIAHQFSVDVVRENMPDEGPTRMCSDWNRIHRTLGWEPLKTFKDGLLDLVKLAKQEE